jgi:hypothetical protein
MRIDPTRLGMASARSAASSSPNTRGRAATHARELPTTSNRRAAGVAARSARRPPSLTKAAGRLTGVAAPVSASNTATRESISRPLSGAASTLTPSTT